jgi:hypothetical protein
LRDKRPQIHELIVRLFPTALLFGLLHGGAPRLFRTAHSYVLEACVEIERGKRWHCDRFL